TIMSLGDWKDYQARAVAHIRKTELGMGELVNQLPPEARVASYDIGGVGYAAQRPIDDISGFADPPRPRPPPTRPHWDGARQGPGGIWEQPGRAGVDYLFLPIGYVEDDPAPLNSGYRLALLGNRALRLPPMRSLKSKPMTWVPAVQATWNSSPRQVMYRVEYT